MNELGIANSVLEAVQEEVARRPGAVALKVGVRIGELSGVDPDALAFGFEVLTSGTEWKDLRLEIEQAAGDRLDVAYLELEEP
jgi:hydrogenase nickel incorporation protein HypA/HybF